MLSFREIYRRDRSTRENEGSAQFWKLFALGLAAVLTGSLFSNISLDLLAAILAIQSILAGFGFNVLVFLSTNKAIGIPISAKIERKLKIERVNKLGQDIFYNISYFNTLALICISVALLIAVTKSFGADELIEIWRKHYYLTGAGKFITNLVSILVPKLLAMLLYFLILVSLLTFRRLIRRATYFFEQKMALSEPE